jgi:hypothetical protein
MLIARRRLVPPNSDLPSANDVPVFLGIVQKSCATQQTPLGRTSWRSSEHEVREKKVVGGVDVKPTPAITDVDTATQILGVLQGVQGMNKTVSVVAEEVFLGLVREPTT